TRPDFTTDGSGRNSVSELPQEGSTEVWEIVNMTADAHPIHLHLTQFQVLNRQPFGTAAYTGAYAAAFPGGGYDPATQAPFPPGVFIPGWGPPLDYATGNPRAGGGNPDIVPFLQGPVRTPERYEAGWKDTVVTYPGQVTRIVVRWAPTDKAVSATDLAYPFSPDGGHGFVWHCHIIDHEDNEMMRPTLVRPKNVTRSYVKGTDY
ncbi:MAG TPA: multicopper oxidase domain-containing protein, partial [Candidatus Eisenbacteria bacterium]|nr:multicopper oxidase domain-containing protein [Candidatus Eisenbacteria bacterium]